jgi:hypothetical protein
LKFTIKNPKFFLKKTQIFFLQADTGHPQTNRDAGKQQTRDSGRKPAIQASHSPLQATRAIICRKIRAKFEKRILSIFKN